MEIAELQRIVEDVSSVYADRNGITRTDEWLVLKLVEEVGELTQAFLARSGQARSKGLSARGVEDAFRAEVADVAAHILLIAERFNVDVVGEIDKKWAKHLPDPGR